MSSWAPLLADNVHFLFKLSCYFEYFSYFCSSNKTTRVMTASQTGALNAEILRNLGTLAEDETMLNRVAKYLRRLVKESEADSTLMTKEEFFARVDEAREQIRQGEGVAMLPEESLDDFLERVG